MFCPKAQFVGASIARPLLPEGQFELKLQKIYLTGARPVIMEIVVLFPACRRRTSDARPYDLYFFAAQSFRKWKYTDFRRGI